jgi:hypothetical protein
VLRGGDRQLLGETETERRQGVGAGKPERHLSLVQG